MKLSALAAVFAAREDSAPPTMRKILISLGVAFLAVLLVLVIALRVFEPRLHKMASDRFESYLQHRFESDVHFSDFSISLLPRVSGTISHLELRHKGRTDIPPLIQVAAVHFEASFFGLFRPRHVISTVRLDELQIHIPPRQPGSTPLISPTDEDLAMKYPLVIGEIIADDARLVILAANANVPEPFTIHHLELHDFGLDRPASFLAVLTIPVPKGDVHATGEFGPWHADEPSLTPTNGQYVLSGANMATFKGLNGTLGSTGKFAGPLDYMEVDGETEIPNFSLRISNNPVDLHTKFSALVDGTNGDTMLKAVTAHFLDTTLDVRGKILDETPMKGRAIDLDAVSRGARIEDLLRLAVKNDPPVMSGSARLKAKIYIGEGNDDILQRMKLEGQFGVAEMAFSNRQVQEKVDTLSHKAEGHPKEPPGDTELSELSGSFRDDKGLMTFSNLSFGVAGARITLAGTYAMDSGEMDFHGTLEMKAKLSQTTTGKKSFFLKAVDPFFKGKNGGTSLPIKITGTKDHPSFGLDTGHGKPSANSTSPAGLP
jgi:AsmA-like C-terminal region